MRPLSATTYPAAGTVLPALDPVRPASGRQQRPPAEQSPAARSPQVVDGVPPGGSLSPPAPFRGDGLEPRARSAIQAYRALDEADSRRRLSDLLGIDAYA